MRAVETGIDEGSLHPLPSITYASAETCRSRVVGLLTNFICSAKQLTCKPKNFQRRRISPPTHPHLPPPMSLTYSTLTPSKRILIEVMLVQWTWKTIGSALWKMYNLEHQ